MKRSSPFRSQSIFFGAISVLALGSVVYAAGPGTPVKGIPYQGRLEQDGNPVSATDVSMTFRLFDGSEADGAATELWSDDFTVDVASGTFNVVLGRGSNALPQSVFDAAELHLAAQVDGVALPGRTQVWAMAQTSRAAEADLAIAAESAAGGNFEVANGRIWRGSDPGGTNDLGLYSQVANNFVRIVSNGGSTVFYNDGGAGSTPDLTIEPGRTTVHDPLTVQGNVTGLTATASACETVQDNQCEVDGGFIRFLDRMNNMSCPANKFMTDWNIINCGNSTYRAQFTCCALTVQ